MAYHNELGKWGEDVAVSYLQQLGYVILHRNWDYHHRDLDIVAIDNGTLVIVEVKTRKNEQFADADEAVTPQKVRSLSIAANAYVKPSGGAVSAPCGNDFGGSAECFGIYRGVCCGIALLYGASTNDV